MRKKGRKERLSQITKKKGNERRNKKKENGRGKERLKAPWRGGESQVGRGGGEDMFP